MTGTPPPLSELLQQLERELADRGMWSATPPDPDALASQAPFCHDRMPFHNWLQWVFIPRVTELLQTGAPLPTDCAIAPMAELLFPDDDPKKEALVQLLRAIDAHFKGSRIDGK